MQHILLGARITEVDVIEADNSVVNLQLLRIFDILNGGFCLNDFIDTATAARGSMIDIIVSIRKDMTIIMA
jgi:hypothetical protein